MKTSNALLSMPTSAADAHAMAARLIERNRGTFGDLRMGPDDPPDDGGTGSGDDGADKGPKLNEHGYPDATQVTDMAPEHQAAYWKHKARKWETNAKSRDDYDAIKAERDRLKQAGMSADEKALDEAKQQAADAARADERAKFGKQLVQAKLEGALKGRIKDEQIAGIVGPLDHNYFLTADGGVDADKVSAYASGFGTAGPGGQDQWPDTGQGKRGQDAPAKGVDAGRDLYISRHKKTE